MGVDLGLVRTPCTCTMSYYYATHRIVLNINATPVLAARDCSRRRAALNAPQELTMHLIWPSLKFVQ